MNKIKEWFIKALHLGQPYKCIILDDDLFIQDINHQLTLLMTLYPQGNKKIFRLVFHDFGLNISTLEELEPLLNQKIPDEWWEIQGKERRGMVWGDLIDLLEK